MPRALIAPQAVRAGAIAHCTREESASWAGTHQAAINGVAITTLTELQAPVSCSLATLATLIVLGAQEEPCPSIQCALGPLSARVASVERTVTAAHL
jgi:hypothetical protein